jgi:hypothetical protein
MTTKTIPANASTLGQAKRILQSILDGNDDVPVPVNATIVGWRAAKDLLPDHKVAAVEVKNGKPINDPWTFLFDVEFNR